MSDIKNAVQPIEVQIHLIALKYSKYPNKSKHLQYEWVDMSLSVDWENCPERGLKTV